jgi:putative transposase
MTLHLVLRAEPAPAQTRLDQLLAAAHADCPVHAYVLMATHLHVLASPRRASDLGALRDALRARECDASRVHARRYLLACMRYIELNPVRAGIVREPGRYAWSSFRANALGAPDPRVTPHPAYYALGRTAEARRAAYRAGFGGTVRSPGSRPAC